MKDIDFITFDLNFQNIPNTIATYVFPYLNDAGKKKWIMVETGPYSCHSTILTELNKNNIDIKDIDTIFITHIHLDHSGGAWAFADHGATIYVHPLGAPHLIEPQKLYDSAKRIYKEKMATLWGEVKPIPANQVVAVSDQTVLTFKKPNQLSNEREKNESYTITSHHTPGHASHHIAWQVNNVLFAGDVCGVKVDQQILEIPAPPPEFHIDQWKHSITKIRQLVLSNKINAIALTHFGDICNGENNELLKLLDGIEDRLDILVAWFRGQLLNEQSNNDIEKLTNDFIEFLEIGYRSQGLNEIQIKAIKNITPPEMSVTGILRYLKKWESLSLT